MWELNPGYEQIALQLISGLMDPKANGRFLAVHPDVAVPEYWNDRAYNQTRQPVVGVSWHDARRYRRVRRRIGSD